MSHKTVLTIFFFLFLLSNSIFAWDNAGHEIIALIAYQRLNAETKTEVDYYTGLTDKQYPPELRFLRASTWADYIKGRDVTAYNAWHYIDIPYAADSSPTKPPQLQNVAWAINQAKQVISSNRPNRYQKAEFLRFLVHFVGDIQQPMHAIDYYSKKHRQGDEGGNLYSLDSQHQNLHTYWDGGAGLFNNHMSYAQLKQLADKISHDYPPSYFNGIINDNNPYDWANESYQIGKQFAYQTPEGEAPSAQYEQKSQQYVEKRIALAGYRLANMLNNVYSSAR